MTMDDHGTNIVIVGGSPCVKNQKNKKTLQNDIHIVQLTIPVFWENDIRPCGQKLDQLEGNSPGEKCGFVAVRGWLMVGELQHHMGCFHKWGTPSSLDGLFHGKSDQNE